MTQALLVGLKCLIYYKMAQKKENLSGSNENDPTWQIIKIYWTGRQTYIETTIMCGLFTRISLDPRHELKCECTNVWTLAQKVHTLNSLLFNAFRVSSNDYLSDFIDFYFFKYFTQDVFLNFFEN